MDPTTEALIDTLGQLADLLESDGDQHWGSWMRRSQIRVANRDYSGIELLLSAYGGMGSFNDLVLGQSEINEQLESLRSRAWTLANEIRREVESG